MELKVRVDGISRIVCGVTESTTCQDVVIALAHAMGRTGTFTLIEKWRENERPLNKAEFPVRVLQKWGEYANEVQLLLQQSDQSNKQLQQESLKEQVKSKDNFKHNFTPPPQKEGPIRRSLTFSGAHNVALPAAKRKEKQQNLHKLQNISEKGNLGGSALSRSLPTYRSSNLPNHTMDQPHQPPLPSPHGTNQHHPYAQVRKVTRNQNPIDSQMISHHSHPQPQEVTHYANRSENHMQQQGQSNMRTDSANKYSHYNGESIDNSRVSAGTAQNKYPVTRAGGSPLRKSPTKIASPVSPTNSGGQSPSLSLYNKNRQSAFSPVIPRQKSPNNQKNLTNGDLDFRVYSPENERPDVVEYDLDSNFPDLYSKQRQNTVLEEYCMPGKDVKSSPVQEVKKVQDDQEFIKMHELITRQKERIKHQESQLEIINSEITSLEKKDIEQANELIKLADEKLKLEQKQKQFESELSKLEPTKWVDIVQAERQAEAKIRSEILEFKSRTTKVGTEFKSLQSKLTSLEKDIKSEKEELKEEKEKYELEEKNLQDELEKVKSEIQVTTESMENEKEAIDKFENELKEMNDELDRKKEEAEELEKELKDVNMKEFKQVTPMGGDKGKSHDSSGEVVLKVLEGRKSPNIGIGIGRKIIASPLSKILSVAKNANGVWV